MSREQGFALSDFEYSRFAESWLREMSFFRIRFSGSGFRGMFFCRIRFAVYVYGSLVLLFNYLFLSVLLHLFPFNSNDGTAAGIKHEATEKLYERHYLVIKIVSSFFACLIKFLYL